MVANERLAEREGFEPSRPLTGPNGFRDRPDRPLRHLSAAGRDAAHRNGPAAVLQPAACVVRSGSRRRASETAGVAVALFLDQRLQQVAQLLALPLLVAGFRRGCLGA